MSRVWAIVLAGGASRRFGSDKLEARLGARRLLEHAIGGLPAQAGLIVVGPERADLDSGRPMSFVREDPPGTGPAAAMVAGLRAGLADPPGHPEDIFLVLPGDTPAAGAAAAFLLETLLADPGACGLVGVDADDRDQPLQLALRASAATRLIDAAGHGAARGASARALVGVLGVSRIGLPADLHTDIDTQEDLRRWRDRQA